MTVLVVFLVGVLVGVSVSRGAAVSYRRRWREAVTLIMELDSPEVAKRLSIPPRLYASIHRISERRRAA